MFFKNNKKENDDKSLINIAALLIHTAKIDENYSIKEEEIINKALLKIGAKNDNIEKIIESANKIEANSNQILNFTKEVKNMNNRLGKNNIEVRPGFPLVNKMICYQDSNIEHLSVSELISSRTICLPSYPDLSEDEQSLIISTVLDK